MGGGELIASFLDEQAIDEFVISVAPVFIGDGIPLIARRHRHVPLDLHSSRTLRRWCGSTALPHAQAAAAETRTLDRQRKCDETHMDDHRRK